MISPGVSVERRDYTLERIGFMNGFRFSLLLCLKTILFYQSSEKIVSQCGISSRSFKFCLLETLTMGCDLIERNEYNTDTRFRTFYDFSPHYNIRLTRKHLQHTEFQILSGYLNPKIYGPRIQNINEQMPCLRP